MDIFLNIPRPPWYLPEVDFILNDGPSYLPLFDSYKPDDQIKLRKSHDDVLDERGKELIDLCVTYQMPFSNLIH
jgi:hypothetical protein